MTGYYTEDHISRIKKALNPRDFLDIALEILELINEDYPTSPITIVCGPISTGGIGKRDGNLKIFNRAILRLSEGGLIVFNQMPFEDDIGRLYESSKNLKGQKFLEEFYGPIFKSGYINLMCFIPGYETSFGANWEHRQGEALGIPRIYLSEYYTRE